MNSQADVASTLIYCAKVCDAWAARKRRFGRTRRAFSLISFALLLLGTAGVMLDGSAIFISSSFGAGLLGLTVYSALDNKLNCPQCGNPPAKYLISSPDQALATYCEHCHFWLVPPKG